MTDTTRKATASGTRWRYLMLALWLSTQARSRIGYKWWRRMHGAAFAVYVLSTLHGLGAGTDSRHTWAPALYSTSVLLVGVLLVM